MRYENLKENKETLELVELPYAMNALEPVMSKKTVEFHYDVLSRGYVDRFNKGEGDPDFNRAGAKLHALWWVALRKPKVNNLPKGASKQFIDDHFGDFDSFKDQFIEAAMLLQGSGWVYLSTKGEIKTLKNQTWKNDILLNIDLWEHSAEPYTTRKDYLKTIFGLINWDVINDRLNSL